MRNIGRPKNIEGRVGIYIRVLPATASRIRAAKHKKGLEQGPFVDVAVSMSDNQIPTLKFFARKITPAKLPPNKKLLVARQEAVRNASRHRNHDGSSNEWATQ